MALTIMDFLVNLIMSFAFMLKGLVLYFTPRSFRSKMIAGEVAVVTGAGSGIGRLMALRLAEEGVHVICWDVNKKGNDETVSMIKRIGGKSHGFIVDVTDKEVVYDTAKKITPVTDGKPVTILINNAGVVIGKGLLDASDEKIEQLMKINTISHFWTVKAFLPGMLAEKKGHIVTIASVAGLMAATSHLVPYFASKFGAVGFDEALAYELNFTGKDYIKTTVVCPYFINTGMFQGCETPFIPNLEPSYVAESAIAAMKANDEYCILPESMRLFVFMKGFLPRQAALALGRAIGFNKAMDAFDGRTIQKK